MTEVVASSRQIVVDGSNLATEGRTSPSLAQLEEVVAELRKEQGDAEITVVVDATFPHRIDQSERPRFEELAQRGELVSPPAGAVGRGDAFLLRIAEKVNGVVLSNDSFQEFHVEHPWLFERGRLIGASHVPGVGWIFVARNPVRGPKSRGAGQENGRARKQVERAIAAATKEAVKPEPKKRSGTKASPGRAPAVPKAVNDPTTFIAFIAETPLGAEMDAIVESFTSHGAVVRFGDVVAYVPLSGLGDPAPKSAREVLKKGERRRFVVTALDPYRRGVEVALPGVGVVSGHPTEETVAAVVKLSKGRETGAGRRPRPAPKKVQAAPLAAKKQAPKKAQKVAKSQPRPVRAASAKKASATSAPSLSGGPRRSPRARRLLTEPGAKVQSDGAKAPGRPRKGGRAKRAG
ncbi:MAG TPA: S1 RNA-binding domain-containing protein [Acidimicrobiales bacterium]|nr:S1 RNA-binding domain-containing protein [Acidimicrobiales bacterium]